MNKNDLSWLKNTIQMLERPDNHDIDEKTISDIKKSLKLIKPRCVSENDRKLILVVESLADSYRFNYEDNSYITKCYKLFWVTQGRASRAEYWYFWLFTTLLSIGAVIIDNIAGTANSESGWGIVLAIVFLVNIVPSITVAVRRLHDINQSGFMILIAIVPLIGGLILLISMLTKGNEGENNYGPKPS